MTVPYRPTLEEAEESKPKISKMHYQTLYDEVFNISQSKSSGGGGGRNDSAS